MMGNEEVEYKMSTTCNTRGNVPNNKHLEGQQ
jgi:hypothetical protein